MQEQGYSFFEKCCIVIKALLLLLVSVFGMLFALTGIPSLISWWVTKSKKNLRR